MKRTLIACVLTICSSATAHAAIITFTVDPSRSSLSLNAQTLLGGSSLPTTPQAANSLTTTYTGTLTVDVESGNAPTVQILTGSQLIAGNSGNWLPGTDYTDYLNVPNAQSTYLTQPVAANYGLITDLSSLPGGGAVNGVSGESPSAIRNLVIGLADYTAKAVLGDGTFNAAGTATDFLSGMVFYSSGGNPPVTDMVNTLSSQPTQALGDSASLVTAGNVTTLTLPISIETDYFVNFLLLKQTLSGTIVATYTSVPEPGTLALVGMAAFGLLRRRRSLSA